MPRGIFLIHPNNSLTELREQPYDSEELLQRLLADHPDVLAGGSDGVRRWLLIAREAPIPDSADGAGRWSLDHVFLDQDGVPTLVEVKRSSDTRIRREVVGQMLDYAANALVYWPADRLKNAFEARCSSAGVDAAAEFARVFGDSIDQAEFWGKAKTNLQAGKVRLVFVADDIPPELRRVVEFLNEQMDPAEVLAIEVRQYVSGDLRTLVPTVLGQTAEAQQRKGVSPAGDQWDEPRFLEALEKRKGAESAQVARRILDWARGQGLQIWWGRGQSGGFVPWTEIAGKPFSVFAVYTYGSVEVYFQFLAGRPPFTDEALRRDLLERLNALPGVSIPPDALRRRPNIPLTTLAAPGVLDGVLKAHEWVISEVRAAKA